MRSQPQHYLAAPIRSLTSLGTAALVTLATYGGIVQAETGTEQGAGIYVCDVASVAELNDAGELERTNFARAIKMYESRFAVDRATGAAMGGSFGTWDAKDVKVLSAGSETEGFKVLWLADAAYTHLKYLSVKSFVEGKRKPFLGLSGNVVITGTCE